MASDALVDGERVRAAEVIGALCLATDLGMGFPFEHGLRTTLVASRLANDSSYGLSATVWTRDRARGEQIARRLDVGAVNVNDMFVNVFAIRLPQGGWKESGVGARLAGAHGIRKYCRPQAITATRLAPRSELLWYP